MTKNNFRSEKRVGKSKAYKADELQKAVDQKNRHFDPDKRSEDRRRAAENKKPYSKFTKKNSNTAFSKVKEGTVPSDKIRINKFLAQGGTCSRREAEKFITAGAVVINGKVVTDLSYRVSPSDLVKFNGQTIRGEKKKYVLLNKPKDFITTTSDDLGRKTVMQLVENACSERIYPVGRLDRNTTGLLLFTNDGDLAKKLAHPKHGVRKIYHVTLDKKLAKHHFNAIVSGLTLDDGPANIDELSYIDGSSHNQVGIELHIGRNRIVRRIFESLGYEVMHLDRVVFGNLTKKDVKRGSWKHLDKKDLELLRML
jgi:23S rRNA pseudouridine2605 synthase